MTSEKNVDLTIFRISEFWGFSRIFELTTFQVWQFFGSPKFFYNYLIEKFLNWEFFDPTNFNPATVNKAILRQLPISQLFKFRKF